MPDTGCFETAREMMHCWKSELIRRASVELVKAGLSELDAGRDYFGPDCLDESLTFNSVDPMTGKTVNQGIVGSAVFMLRSASVIVDCWRHDPENGIVHGRRKSLRASANGRKVSLYSLQSRAAAESFLRRHGVQVAAKQAEFALV